VIAVINSVRLNFIGGEEVINHGVSVEFVPSCPDEDILKVISAVLKKFLAMRSSDTPISTTIWFYDVITILVARVKSAWRVDSVSS
jgi:hypothetical protein